MSLEQREARERAAIITRLQVAVIELRAAAAPTKSEVFTCCGAHASQLADDLEALMGRRRMTETPKSLRVRLFTQPADDPTWMHFRFTREPNEGERHAIAKAVSLFLASPEADRSGLSAALKALRPFAEIGGQLHDAVRAIRTEIDADYIRAARQVVADLSDTPRVAPEAITNG